MKMNPSCLRANPLLIGQHGGWRRWFPDPAPAHTLPPLALVRHGRGARIYSEGTVVWKSLSEARRLVEDPRIIPNRPPLVAMDLDQTHPLLSLLAMDCFGISVEHGEVYVAHRAGQAQPPGKFVPFQIRDGFGWLFSLNASSLTEMNIQAWMTMGAVGPDSCGPWLEGLIPDDPILPVFLYRAPQSAHEQIEKASRVCEDLSLLSGDMALGPIRTVRDPAAWPCP